MHSSDDDDVIVIGAGQAGLATAYQLQKAGMRCRILEGSDTPAGSWPRYYDSLVLFSPARYSSLPGLEFPGDPKHYPTRDEVTSYLTRYAHEFGFLIEYDSRVVDVRRDTGWFLVVTESGKTYRARAVVVATGSFSHPNVPQIDGQETFKGRRLHALDYREPSQYRGQRVVVVGAGNTAVQIAVELAEVAVVTLATREPIRYLPQRILGLDIHVWFHYTKLDRTKWISDQSTPVLDDGTYRKAIGGGKPQHRPMFKAFYDEGVIWNDGVGERVDAVIFGTGYRSTASYLKSLAALDERGIIMQEKGVSPSVPGLYYVGFSKQRNFASATLRGVGPDASYVVNRLATYLAR